jgi:hypothetical protein
MPITASTVENLTVLTGTGGATTIFTPSPAGDNRFRFRVIRVVATGTIAIGDGVTITGITNTHDDSGQTTETQTLFISAAATANPYTDTCSFPDECEFRGKIQAAITSAAGSVTVFLYHG